MCACVSACVVQAAQRCVDAQQAGPSCGMQGAARHRAPPAHLLALPHRPREVRVAAAGVGCQRLLEQVAHRRRVAQARLCHRPRVPQRARAAADSQPACTVAAWRRRWRRRGCDRASALTPSHAEPSHCKQPAAPTLGTRGFALCACSRATHQEAHTHTHTHTAVSAPRALLEPRARLLQLAQLRGHDRQAAVQVGDCLGRGPRARRGRVVAGSGAAAAAAAAARARRAGRRRRCGLRCTPALADACGPQVPVGWLRLFVFVCVCLCLFVCLLVCVCVCVHKARAHRTHEAAALGTRSRRRSQPHATAGPRHHSATCGLRRRIAPRRAAPRRQPPLPRARARTRTSRAGSCPAASPACPTCATRRRAQGRPQSRHQTACARATPARSAPPGSPRRTRCTRSCCLQGGGARRRRRVRGGRRTPSSGGVRRRRRALQHTLQQLPGRLRLLLPRHTHDCRHTNRHTHAAHPWRWCRLRTACAPRRSASAAPAACRAPHTRAGLRGPRPGSAAAPPQTAASASAAARRLSRGLPACARRARGTAYVVGVVCVCVCGGGDARAGVWRECAGVCVCMQRRASIEGAHSFGSAGVDSFTRQLL
jgi:hypothetical protein